MDLKEGAIMENGNDLIHNDHVEESVIDSKEVVQNVDSDKNVLDVNGVYVAAAKDEDPNVTEVAVKASVTSAENKTSKHSKEPRAGTKRVLKNNKVVKDQPNVKEPSLPGKQKIISQSLSFPARGARSDGMKESIDGHPVKSEAKSSLPNGSQMPVSNRSSNSATRSTHPINRRASTVLNSNEAKRNGGASSLRRTTIAALSKTQQSEPGISASAHGMDNIPPSEVSLPVDQIPKPLQNVVLIKEEDDIRSTTSSTPRGQRRSSTSGFAFRLDERAEKRKEFFSKLEEKINAKEVEKSTVQEKSKESQEAEIKQLRKSLTFKATPMPTFYKEPPQKAELKKIPTTRPISPKLGRNKITTVSTKQSLENGAFCTSPHLNREKSKSFKGAQVTSDKDLVGPKKVLKKSQSKLSKDTSAVKTEQKGTEPESQNQNSTVSLRECDGIANEKEPILISVNPENLSSEVSVGD